MVIDEIKATRTRRLGRTQTNIIHDEMPMWRAEVHLIGVRKAELEDPRCSPVAT